jgi:Ca-activated chloride channel family protein
MERFAEAQDAYTAAYGRAATALRTKIDFALGNTALALGDIAGAIAHYDACVASRSAGSDLDAVRRDAAENRRFALESARRSPAPTEGSGGTSPVPKSRRPPSEGPDQGNPQRKASRSSVDPDAATPDRSRPGRRGQGGAGGSGTVAPGEGAPEERLESALERVRESRRHRLPEPPPVATGNGQKEW